MEQITHRREGRCPIDPLLATDVDGQLGRLVQLLRQSDRADLAAQHPRPLQGKQRAMVDLDQIVEKRLDPLSLVHRHRHQRKILRQRQQAVGAQVVFEPEALDTPHQDTRGDLPLAAAVEDHVGEKPAFGAAALTEVGGELETVVVHHRPPSHRPTPAAKRPTTRLTTMFAARAGTWRSSARR